MPSPTALRCRGRFSVIVATPRSTSSSTVRYPGPDSFGCDGRALGTPVSSPWPVHPSRHWSSNLTQAATPPAQQEIWPGKAYPLGATYDGSGTNFAVFSEVAERVELCLFDADGAETRLTLPEVDGFV